MKTGYGLKNRQGGAVAVMVGISMVLLVGFLAMVIDLGHLYVAKAGLQNAADAAALAGVKELDGTSDGVTLAREKAIDVAKLNTFFASTGQTAVDLDSSNIQFGVSQSGPWDDGSSPAGKFFIKVDTASRNLTTWFAPIWNIFTTSTFGMAVAGSIMQNVAPLAVCALTDSSATEYGFRRGVSYNIIEVNERYEEVGGFTSVPLFLNPVNIPPATCNPSNGSNSFMDPFVCQGTSALGQVSKGSWVYVNTGITSAQNKSFNSRFNNYRNDDIDSNGSPCDMLTAPPDKNIKEFLPPPASCTPPVCSPYTTPNTCNAAPSCQWKAGKCVPKTPANCSNYVNWINPLPTQQAATLPWPPASIVSAADYGVLWSYTKPAASGVPAGSTVSEAWAQLYPTGVSAVNPAQVSYTPSSTLLDDWTAPYAATTAPYFEPPTDGGAAYATANRRVINMVLVDCPENKASSCAGKNGMPGQTVPVLGIVSFFMTRPAELPDRLDVEFGRVVSAAELKRQYRLFR